MQVLEDFIESFSATPEVPRDHGPIREIHGGFHGGHGIPRGYLTGPRESHGGVSRGPRDSTGGIRAHTGPYVTRGSSDPYSWAVLCCGMLGYTRKARLTLSNG